MQKLKMSKRKFILVLSGTVAATDWDICFLRQQNRREKLKIAQWTF